MKLFRRRVDAAQPVNQPVASPLTVPEAIPAEPVSAGIQRALELIALSAEQREILEKPIDPRVERILQELHADKAAAEDALKTRRIIKFPGNDWTDAHVVQDENGFWRISSGPAFEQNRPMLRQAAGSGSIPI
jgi:hypothetical protein